MFLCNTWSLNLFNVLAICDFQGLGLNSSATCKVHFNFHLSGLIRPADSAAVLMAGSASVKPLNKEHDCSVYVLLPVGVTAQEWS